MSPSRHVTVQTCPTTFFSDFKLVNFLLFRYKDIADIINAAKVSGTHTPEDDIMVHKKAHAIINCYIDSAVSPRVQVAMS